MFNESSFSNLNYNHKVISSMCLVKNNSILQIQTERNNDWESTEYNLPHHFVQMLLVILFAVVTLITHSATGVQLKAI